MTLRPPWPTLVLLLVAFASKSAPVCAEDVTTQARASFDRGVAASREQRWEEARSAFKSSLALVPKPTTLFNLAIAEIKLGLGRDALATLEAFDRSATQAEHAALLARAPVLRGQAEALVTSERATAEHGGNALGDETDGLSAQARKDVAAGREHYERGRDREALEAFERAYRDSPRPQLLYNIGVVADRLREDERAVRAYGAFLAALPDAPEAAVAQRRRDTLLAGLLERSPSPPANPSVNLAPAPPQRDAPLQAKLAGPRALLVIGPALVAGLLGSLVWYLNRVERYDACDSHDDCLNRDVLQRQRRAALAITVVQGAAGLALTSVAATLLVHRKHAGQEARLALLPELAFGREGAGSLVLRGRF